MDVLACRGALTAQGSRRTRDSARRDVAFRFPNNVSTLDWLISQLHTSPTSAPVNASPLPLRPDTHDSGKSVVRYTFTIEDLHLLSIASSPGALWTRPRCQGLASGATRFGTDAVIYTYMDSSRPASSKLMMSDREPRAYIRPLVGERPPGPDVLRSLSPQRPHGNSVRHNSC